MKNKIFDQIVTIEINLEKEFYKAKNNKNYMSEEAKNNLYNILNKLSEIVENNLTNFK